MSKREFTVELDGTVYTMRPFNLDQLERIAEMMDAGDVGPMKRGFAILRLALKENATPPVDDPGKLELTQPEMLAAANAVMIAAGLIRATPQGEATPPASAATH